MNKKFIFHSIALMLIFGILQFSCSNSVETSTQKNNESIKIPDIVNYETLEEWDISHGGKGRVLIINPKQSTNEELKKLGERLNYDNRNNGNAFAVVFNNKKAAGMYHKVSDLNNKDGAFYDQHFVATYNRNISAGFNEIQIRKDGLYGKSFNIKY